MNFNTHKISEIFPNIKIWSAFPAFTGWLALSCGIFISGRFPLFPVSSLYHSCIPYAIFLLLFGALIFRNIPIRLFFFFIAGYFLFSFQIQYQYDFYNKLSKFFNSDENSILSGKLISAPLFSNEKYTFLISAEKIYTDKDTFALDGKNIKCVSTSQIPSFGTIICSGYFHAPRSNENPYTFNEHYYLSANKIWGRFIIDSLINISSTTSICPRIIRYVRTTVLKAISHVNNVSIQGILQAVFLGEKNRLTSTTKLAFREAGIYHLLAISGLHVGILIASILLILTLFPISHFVKIVLTILFIWAYLFFIGFIPSLFRSVIMATLILFSTVFQKKNQVINSLGIAGILWLIISPISLYTPGYQLSFAATFGIVTLFPVLNSNLIHPLQNISLYPVIKPILSSFFISFAGFISTTPILIYHFGNISLFGLIANIAAVFLMGIAMNTFFLGIVFQLLWQPLSVIAMKITEFILYLISAIANFSFYFPYASIKIPIPYTEFFILYCLVFIGFVLIDKRYILSYTKWIVPIITLFIPLIILFHNIFSYTEVIFFSTEKGSLTGICFPNKKIWLIGSSPEESYNRPYRNVVEPWLRHFMLKNFDLIFLPHVSRNVVHDLDPVLSDNLPKKLIACGKPSEKLLKDNFYSFLRNYNMPLLEPGNKCKFVAAKQCTCTVYPNMKEIKWYEKGKPAVFYIKVGNTSILINSADYKKILPKAEAVITRVKDRIDIHTKSNINNFITKQSPVSFSTESEGAVIIRLNLKGITRIKTMKKGIGFIKPRY